MHREFTQLLCFRTKSFAFETPNFAYVHMCRSPKEQSEKEYSCSSSREREEVKKSEFFPAVNVYSPVDCAICMFIKHDFKATQNP